MRPGKIDVELRALTGLALHARAAAPSCDSIFDSGHADAASSYAQAAPGGSWATTPPPVVPTLGQWAMSALALMLAGLGLASRRARAHLI